MHQDTLHLYLKAIQKSGQLCFPGLSLLAHAQRAHGPQFRAELPCSALTYSALRTAPQTCSWYGLRFYILMTWTVFPLARAYCIVKTVPPLSRPS